MKKTRESLFQSWFKYNADAVFIMDYNGLILETNSKVLRKFNISYKQLIQLSFFDLFIWPEMESGLKRMGKEKQSIFEGIHQIRTKNNKAIEINISSISYEGKKVLLCLSRDISTRHEKNKVTEDIAFEAALQQKVEELKEQYSTIQTIINNSDAIIFSVNKQYKYTSFNTRHVSVMKQIYGKEPEIGISILDIMSVKEDREKAKANLDRTLAGEQLIQESYSGEELLSRRYFRVSHSPIKTNNGEVIGVVILAQDLTDRKKAEEIIKNSEEKYRTLIQKIQAAVVVHASDTRILSSNSMAQELLGLTEEQMLGKSSVDPEWHFFREDGNKMPQNEYPVNVVLSTKKELRNYIVGVHRSNQNKDVWALVSADPVLGRDNEIVQVIVTFVDITTRKKAQEELQETHQELMRTLKFNEALLSAIPTPVFYKDRKGRYLGCNRAFSEFMGITQDQIKGKTVYELWPDKHAKVYHKKDLELIKNPARQIYEFKVRDKDGLERPVIYSKDIFRDEKDQVKGIVGAFMDITDRKLAEEALQQAHDEMEQKVEKRTVELKKANEQLTALYKIGKAITAPLNLKKVLNLIALNTAKLLKSDTGVILLIDEKGEFLTIEGSYGLSKEVVKGTRDRLGESIAGRVVLKGEPIIANDLPNDPRFYNPSAANEGLLSCASVPMTVGGKAIGTLDIHSKKDRDAFKEEHIQILNMLASQAAIAIENSRLYEKIQRAKDELEIRVQERTAELEATNARLKSREMELRNLAESSPGLMGTFYLRPDGSVCMPYTSPQIQNLYGLNSEDVIDDATILMERTHPDDIDQVKATMTESAQTMTLWHHEFRVLHPTRGELWLEGSINPKPHPDGGVIWYGFVHDITKRKHAEAALWESSQMLKLVLNNIPAFVFWKDRKSVYLGCNKLFAINAGLKSPEEIVGKTDLDLPWKDTEAESYRSDDHSVITTENSKLNYEETQHTADGKTIWVKTSKIPLRDINGEVIGVLGTFEDITERKRMISELQRSNSLLKTIIEAAPVAIIGLDLDGLVHMVWNPAAEKMLGWSAEEVMGKPPPMVSHEKKEEFRDFRDRIRKGLTLDGIEVIRQKQDGTPIDYTIYASPLHDSDGNISGNIAVLVDITEIKHNYAINESRLHLMQFAETHSVDELLEETLNEAEKLTGSIISFYHFIEDDQKTLTFQNWSKRTKSEYFSAKGKGEQYSLTDAGVWAECVHQRKPVIHNDYASLSNHKSMPKGHLKVIRILIVPVLRGKKVKAILGIGNKPVDYREKDMETTSLLANFTWEIAERKLAEEALRASEERFSAVFHYSPIAITIFRADDESFVDMNDVFLDLSGYSRDELIGHTTIELGVYRNPSDRDRVLQTLKEKNSGESVEIELLNKAGEIRTVLIALTYIFIKKVRHYVALLLDITDRKKSEEKLHLLNKALEATANSIVITDKTAKIIWANNAFSKLTGYSLDEVMGKNPRELVYSGIHSTEFYQHMWNTILSGNEWDGEIINKRNDGSLFNELLTITPVRDENNEIRHFIAVKQDISDRKKAEAELRKAKEKAEESNRLKDAFLATMNHELRTPLNHIIGFSDLIRSGPIVNEIPQYADIIHRSSMNLLEIIEDIFQLAMIEQSEIKIRLQTFKCLDLFIHNKSVLNEILNISGKSDQIELTFNADKKLLIQTLTADMTKINQVLVNLFKNAVKFTKSGKIEFGLKKDDSGYLVFYVKDTGIGIPEDKHEVIFEFFRQADDSNTREYGGVGIGLAISQRIAKVIKGSLTVDSKPDKGSTFYFRIPVTITDFKINFEKENGRISMLNLQDKTIIIAEDDHVSAELIKKYLSNTGAEIIEVSNGKEVIKKLNLNPDVLLIDLNMPVMDGYTATRLVKLKRPDIPVIAITAYALQTDQNKAREAGCDSIISKPVDKSILYEELKKYLLLD